MTNLLIVGLILAVSSLAAAEEGPRLITFFNCQELGNFRHPDKCTAYVQCDSNLTAYEILCPVCTDPALCPEGRLHYSIERGACDGVELAKCPSPDECDVTCMQEGNCDTFDTCVPDNSSSTGGRWRRGVRCDAGLYWNPNYAGNGHGGSCDFWDNLSPEVQEEYRLDQNCITPALECYWAEDPDCDNKYFYLPHDSKQHANLQHLSCPVSPDGVQLFWNQHTKSCGFTCNSSPNCTICA